MIAGDITAIHTNITRAEHEQWKVTASNILTVLKQTSHPTDHSTIPLVYLQLMNYLYPYLSYMIDIDHDENTQISMIDAKTFIEECDDIIPLVFTDDKLSTSQFSGCNPAIGQAIEKMHSRMVYNHPVFNYLSNKMEGFVSTIVATNSFLEHRIIISYLIECVNENKFTPDILLPEYLQLSFKRQFNFPWTGQPVNSQLLIDFLLHCHYKPFLIQFTNKQESTS